MGLAKAHGSVSWLPWSLSPVGFMKLYLNSWHRCLLLELFGSCCKCCISGHVHSVESLAQ